METLMVDRVQSSLGLFMNSNAIFICERLCAEFPSELNLQLLATCYLRNNQAYSAYHILREARTPQSRYLFALSCFQMNLLREAEAALSPANDPNAEVPNGAAGHYILGLIYRYTGRRTRAIDHFMLALAIDPLLWAAYEELCVLGAAEEANECFNDAAALRIQHQHFSESSSQNVSSCCEDQHVPYSRILATGDSSPKQSKQAQANFTDTREVLGHSTGVVLAAAHATNSGSSNLSQYNTPSPTLTQLSGIAPPRLLRNAVKMRKTLQTELLEQGTRRSMRIREANSNSNSNASQVGGKGTGRSSNKFFKGLSSSSSKMGQKVALRRGQLWSENLDEGRRAEVFDDSRADSTAVTSSSLSNPVNGRYLEQAMVNSQIVGNPATDSKVTNGIRELLVLLRILGEGYRLSCMYRCQEALEVYQKLPQHQYNTGWVLCQVGKAYFELVDYLEAERFFDLARRASPYTLEGMDIYSTVLFHLKEEMKLSYLAKELISTDRLSPQAWCAMGNCYSLQKDHETALKNFQRAVHLDSRFTYAHTLCGHEYVALEDFENGIKCYQSALQVDDRNFKSWYGLGVVYFRQEKFEFAEHHFRRAHCINPHSSVINCYLGMVLHSLKKNEEALQTMEKAILVDPKNPLPMYQKALILQSLERYVEALNTLKQLTEFTPSESSIYALMGKIYKRCNMHEKAMFYFGLALDLKPPAADIAIIKSAMEKLHLPDEFDDTL